MLNLYNDVVSVFAEAAKLGRDFDNCRFLVPLMSSKEPDWLEADEDCRKRIEQEMLVKARAVKIVARPVAKQTLFRNGLRPCKRCGTSKRYLCDGSCVQCRRFK